MLYRPTGLVESIHLPIYLFDETTRAKSSNVTKKSVMRCGHIVISLLHAATAVGSNN